MLKNIAIFASGSGTNAENIIHYFRGKAGATVNRIYSNNPDAFVLKRAEKYGIPQTVFSRQDFYSSEKVIKRLALDNTDLIVLAGFLWLIPQNILAAYPHRIVNIHPALLPKYGGKGMYGHHVHEAVIRSGDRESGITIHYVNERYDEGRIIFQAKCPVLETDNAGSLAAKIHELEYRHFPRVIEEVILKL